MKELPEGRHDDQYWRVPKKAKNGHWYANKRGSIEIYPVVGPRIIIHASKLKDFIQMLSRHRREL